MSRGTEEEKLRWVFELYDIDHDGYLTRDDMETVIGSIYSMMGSNTEPPVATDTVKDHVNDVFDVSFFYETSFFSVTIIFTEILNAISSSKNMYTE